MLNAKNNQENRDSRGDSASRIVKLGLDVHLGFIMVAVQIEGSIPKRGRKMSAADLLKFVEELVAQGDEVYSVYEACSIGFDLHRNLKERGVVSLVIAPIKLNEKSAKRKNDKLDAHALCLHLDRYVSGNTEALPVIREPSVEEQRFRAMCRQRDGLLEQRKMFANRGRSLVLYHFAMKLPSGWWGPRKWKQVSEYCDEWTRSMLEPLREIILKLQKEIDALTELLQDSAPSRDKLPRGLGGLSWSQISAEVCDWNRFNNRRQVGSYTGCCPGEHSTGGKQRMGSIDRHGNPRLRKHLVEAVWRLIQWNPGYWAIQKFRDVLLNKQQHKGAKKKAVIAVARLLAVDLWRIATERCSLSDLGLQPAQPTPAA